MRFHKLWITVAITISVLQFTAYKHNSQSAVLVFMARFELYTTQQRHNGISRLSRKGACMHTSALCISFTWVCFLYLSVKPTIKSSYLSRQNAAASQAAVPPPSTLGICHTSLPSFCCFGHNNNNIVCSPPPWAIKRGQICFNKTRLSKTFTCIRLSCKTR